MGIKENFYNGIQDHLAVFNSLPDIAPQILEAGEVIAKTLEAGKKILVCGNGGSASDAQHFAAEIIGRFEIERGALPSIALTTDTSILTAVGNDYGFETIFSRQVDGLGVAGDVFIGISTSGNSPNIIKAVEKAGERSLKTICLLGRDGGRLASRCDLPVTINHSVTARIQEAHIFILHFWASAVDANFSK